MERMPDTPEELHERERLQTLRALEILDSESEDVFDGIVEIAASVFEVPTAFISLVDEKRLWFKARVGLEVCENERGGSFCAHAIQQNEIFEILDASGDHRFHENPLVTGSPHIRYYAGVPLFAGNGHVLGALCLVDYKARSQLTAMQRKLLWKLARQTVELFEARRLREVGRVAKLIGDTTSDAIVLSTPEDVITQWNPAAEKLFGWSAAEAVGQPMTLIVPEHLHEAHRAALAQLTDGHKANLRDAPVQVSAIRRSGEEVPIELSLACWRERDHHRPGGFVAIIRDRTKQKKLEDDLKASEAFLSTVVESLPSMLFVKNAETRAYEMFNQAGEELTGLGRQNVLGKTDAELFPQTWSGYSERDDRVAATGEVLLFESDFKRADGKNAAGPHETCSYQRSGWNPFHPWYRGRCHGSSSS